MVVLTVLRSVCLSTTTNLDLWLRGFFAADKGWDTEVHWLCVSGVLSG